MQRALLAQDTVQFHTLIIWVVGCATCVAAGWILSLFHALNLFGYALLAILLVTLAIAKRTTVKLATNEILRLPRIRCRRARMRALPMLYYSAAILAFIGGVLHDPNNYDALTYRVPRLLHWWSTGSWHWIVTNNPRMNFSAEGFEWLMMPLFIFTKSDRLFFLLNWGSYLFLPGLIFSVFRQLGIAPRVAWLWMWLVPLSYCYVLQAGSICNDAFAATFVLASLHFALRAKTTGNIANVWLALLAAGLSSGIKAVNLPLYLPIGIVILPVLGHLRSRLVASAAVLIITVLVSFVPTALLNAHYTGSWTGDPLDKESVHVKSPALAVIGNTIQIADENLAPPVLPFARKLENTIWQKFPERLRSDLAKGFPRFLFHLGELPQEEATGLGLGTITLLAVTLIAAVVKGRPGLRFNTSAMVVGFASWIALFAFMVSAGLGFSTGRLVSAYYPLLIIPIVALAGNMWLVRKKFWVAFATLSASFALIPLLLTPSRPIVPVLAIFDQLAIQHPADVQLARASQVYRVYKARHDIFQPMRELLPADVRNVGFISSEDDTELSLWYPFGSRTVQHVTNAAAISSPDLQWFVSKRSAVESETGSTMDNWTRSNQLAVVRCISITEKVSVGPEDWCLVHKIKTP